MSFLSPGFMMWKSNLISSSTRYREISTTSSSDVEAIKDVLHAQQQLLLKLYAELDEERELSSSAADEAMSMILRLQGEKARLKMEASQYKREAEEKMCLAEESIAIFEDLMEQKESEIVYLEFQVQYYKDKLNDMGYTDLTIPEFEYSDILDDNNVVGSETDNNQSVNAICNAMKRRSVEIKRSNIPIIPKKMGAGGTDASSYWEHIKKLDEQVKKISNNRMSRGDEGRERRSRPLRSCSVPPPEKEDSSLASSPAGHGGSTKLDMPNIPKCPAPVGV